ncbi:hypothetical protein ABID29_001780 [Streptococcus rupicaprae]|uniref:Transposase n=1 Tax=Streptococcus rupicaprae TaxID=759619 RepID=A0ABV2FJC0_9STRE
MRPKRWPYSGIKKQPTKQQVAELINRVAVCETSMSQLAGELHYSKVR